MRAEILAQPTSLQTQMTKGFQAQGLATPQTEISIREQKFQLETQQCTVGTQVFSHGETGNVLVTMPLPLSPTSVYLGAIGRGAPENSEGEVPPTLDGQ